MPYGENCTRNRCHREHGEMGGCKRSSKTGVLHPHLDGKDVNAIVCIHLQRLEVKTICAVVLTCDGDVLDEERWGAGVVEQVSLAMKLEFPDADGFSMYYTQGGEENTMFFRIGSKKRFFFADYASFGGHYVWGFRRLMVYYVVFVSAKGNWMSKAWLEL